MNGIAAAQALLSGPCGIGLKIVAHTASALAQYRDEAQRRAA